ncbi:KAP family P-loop NTPase fold protein [Poseidonibacter antarcticus]|uniref:KAP family P-loop NTPase fold protein n=1 Tax=Poseidonibacter antarcticus TaxID=2478538 RepID=UPI000EF4E726|nr:P-loop NTPase fold protein [Poseidonibacter antarcticus]
MHHLEEDLLERKDEIDFLILYLTNRYGRSKDTSFENKSFVLNINANWGSGKTYFLKSLSNKLQEQNYSVVEFDAWKNDYTKEPLLAFVSEISNSFDNNPIIDESKTKKFIKSSTTLFASFFVKQLTGMSLETFSENITNISDDTQDSITELTTNLSKDLIKNHIEIKNSIKVFKNSINSIIEDLKDKKLPMFILIDELDRCRPNYAIELLENIKHLFDIEGLYFIIATDSTQLSYSINAVYGNKFASEKYLKRFFDQEYKLKTPSNYEYINSLFKKYNLLDDEILFSPLEEGFYEKVNTKVKLFELFVELFDLKPRDINQVMISLHAIRITYNSEFKIHLPYLLFLIMLKHSDNNRYKEFLEIIKNKRTSNKPFEELMLEINTNYSDIKVKTHVLQSNKNDIPLFSIITFFAEFYSMEYKDFKRSKTSSNILGIIKQSIKEEDTSTYEDDKIVNISIFNYPNLVEHTGQLS